MFVGKEGRQNRRSEKTNAKRRASLAASESAGKKATRQTRRPRKRCRLTKKRVTRGTRKEGKCTPLACSQILGLSGERMRSERGLREEEKKGSDGQTLKK